MVLLLVAIGFERARYDLRDKHRVSSDIEETAYRVPKARLRDK